MARLQNKTAVITGGTTGIGLASAQQFIQEGARVIITGRSEERLAQAVETLGVNAISVKADASDLADLDQLATRVQAEFGTLDILFANAGVAKSAPFREVTEASLDEEMANKLLSKCSNVRQQVDLTSLKRWQK